MLALQMFAFAAFAGNPVIRYLQVVDAVTGDVLIGARVAIEGTDIVLYSDPEGMISLEDLVLDSNAEISVSYISYVAVEVSFKEITKSGKLGLEPR